MRRLLFGFTLLLLSTTCAQMMGPRVLLAAATAFAPAPKEMFYNPGDLRDGDVDRSASDPTNGLRAIRLVSPFPMRGHVGIHYWLESSDGTRLAATRIRVGAVLTLHMRSNVAGFPTVWSNATGLQLTAMQGQSTGYLLDGGHKYVVPGMFRLARSSSEGVIFVFARSQTEAPRTADGARAKLEYLSTHVAADGMPSLVSESDEETPAQIGTYVVNRDGNQPGAEIPVTSVGS